MISIGEERGEIEMREGSRKATLLNLPIATNDLLIFYDFLEKVKGAAVIIH